MINKIALLSLKNEIPLYEINKIHTALSAKNITSKLFDESDNIDEFNPDCVIVLSPQQAKLTRFPTYGLINRPVNEYLELPRFVRNILTYDGYLTVSPRLKQMLEDLTFGARKLDSSIANFDFAPSTIEQKPLSFETIQLTYFEPEIGKTRYKKVIQLLQEKITNLSVLASTWGLNSTITLIKNENDLLNQFSTNIGLCLESGHNNDKIISPRLLEIIASGAIAIAPHTEFLESIFGKSILYFSPTLSYTELCEEIVRHLQWVQNNLKEAQDKATQAYEIYYQSFAFDQLIKNLHELHSNTLVKKGFLPHQEEKIDDLPSVTYIIRTGGKNKLHLERALNSLVQQNYPKLQALLVVHKDFNYINELVVNYPSLKIKIIKSYNSSRSQAICEGMAAVETDLFGLHDDDDELHPNHVRTLVKTLKYHDNRDWRGPIGLAYSGSIMIDKNKVFEYEQEFLDIKLNNVGKRRSIEHFRFYQPIRMANHLWYMMSNSWLAKRSLLDNELLTNPGIDTCEDLYFELQFAQRTHFAFSVEATVFHYFHSQNSTIIDKNKHIPDNQRIALRNCFRTFSGDFQFDTHYNPLGQQVLNNQELGYLDTRSQQITPLYHIENMLYPTSSPQFCSSYQVQYTSRILHSDKSTNNILLNLSDAKKKNALSFITKLFKTLTIGQIFLSSKQSIKKVLIHKWKMYYREHGLRKTISRMLTYNYNNVLTNQEKTGHPPIKEKLLFNKFKTSFSYLYSFFKKNISRKKIILLFRGKK